MKTCSYCGKQYPDEATVCVEDGESLSGAVTDRKKVTGVWRGVYGHPKRENQAEMGPVAFTLKLKQGWLAHFDGTVAEDAPAGMPGTGTVDGYFNSPMIEFTKQMPVGYLINPDGTRMTLREHLIAEGHQCEHDLPALPIFYQGTLLDANRMQGTWIINAQRIPLPGGQSLPMPQTSGFWCAEYITSDARANPTGGPAGPLFDKTRLSPRELEDVEGVAFRSLGNFNVADAEALLERFGQENIRFEIKRDDDAMHQVMPIQEMTGGYAGTAQMIEVFVHPDDEADAQTIIHQDDQV